MEAPSIIQEANAFERLNEDVLRLILDCLYEACLRDFEKLESVREKQNKAVKMLLHLGYTSRNFAKLVLPYVWKYVRIVTSSRHSHNIVISDILKKDEVLFSYGEYLRELEINFTAYSGDESCYQVPAISSLLEVVANRCTNIQQLNFIAKVAKVDHRSTNSIYDENCVNQAFQRVIFRTKTKWDDFVELVSKAFGQGSLTEVTLGSDFYLMDDECLTHIAEKNPKIKKLSLRGSQFTHDGMKTALQFLSGSLKELEICNSLGDGRVLKSSPLNISIDSLLRPCRSLQSIHLVGIKYNHRFADDLEKYVCPLQSIEAENVDEETLNHLFSIVDKQTLSRIRITNPYDVVKWDSFLRSSILPFATDGSLEDLTLFILRCQNHRYSSHDLNPKTIMKNIMKTLQISEDTANSLCLKLKQWKIFVGKDTGDHSYSVESEAVDFVSKECILNYDRLQLSEYN